MTGLDPDEVMGKLVQEVIPEPSCSLVLERYREAVSRRETVQWTEETDYPSGKKVGAVSVTPVLDTIGKCIELIGTVHDHGAQTQSGAARRQRGTGTARRRPADQRRAPRISAGQSRRGHVGLGHRRRDHVLFDAFARSSACRATRASTPRTGGTGCTRRTCRRSRASSPRSSPRNRRLRRRTPAVAPGRALDLGAGARQRGRARLQRQRAAHGRHHRRLHHHQRAAARPGTQPRTAHQAYPGGAGRAVRIGHAQGRARDLSLHQLDGGELFARSPIEIEADFRSVLSRIHAPDLPRLRRSMLHSAENLASWRAEYRVELPR